MRHPRTDSDTTLCPAMTQIDDKQLLQLARAVADTANDEINCEVFLDLAADYLEAHLRAGAVLSPDLKAVEQHLRVCPECFEEFQMLKDAVRG